MEVEVCGLTFCVYIWFIWTAVPSLEVLSPGHRLICRVFTRRFWLTVTVVLNIIHVYGHRTGDKSALRCA